MKQNNNFELDVRVTPIKNSGNVKAYASVNIGSAFAVKNLRIIEGNKGLFVAMPSVKNHKGEYDDIFFAISKESRAALNNAVITAYEQKLEMSDGHEQQNEPVISM